MKNFIKANKENIIIIAISLIALIAGCFAIGWGLSLVIVGIADLALLLTPIIIKKVKHGKKKRPIQKALEKNKKKEKKTKTKKKGKLIIKIFKILIIIFFVMFIIGIVVAALLWKNIVDNAPEFDPELLYHQESSIVYDMYGNEIKTLATEKRENISYDELPEVLVNAIIATEDSRFFQHNGFDLLRFTRATIAALLGQDGGGASTLTMQVSKNTYTSKEVSLTRKFTDIYMAMFQIEKNYTKKEIIEFYVNYPYLGGGAYGVEQACLNYFGKSAKDINLAEAALIAGLFQSPGGYDPYIYPERAEKRRKTVLYLMERHGYITTEQKEAAEKMTVDKLLISTEKPGEDYTNQSFIDYVLEEIANNTDLDPYTTSMEIYTTLDPDKQSHVYKILKGETFTWENDVVDAGIAVVDVKSGAVLALGGGRNKDGAKTFNNATELKNQIGSTSKPIFDYAVGIEYEDWSTYTPFVDEEYQYSNGTKINNWDGKYKGWMTAREALAQSRNIPALKAFQANKNANIKEFVTNLGLHPEIDANSGLIHEAHAIGGYTGESPLNMAVAYAAFANQGYYTEPYSYTKIVLRETGETIENTITKRQVMGEDTAYMMTSMLQSSAQYGLGNQSYINGAVYGAKTGTTNFDQQTKDRHGLRYDAVRDLWVSGTSPDYAISVWYGYDHIDPNYTNTVNTFQHTKLFNAVAKGVFKTGSTFTKPDSVVEVQIEKGTEPAKLPSDQTPGDLIITELFKKGTEPTEVSTKYMQLENVKNLKSNLDNKKVTLTWDKVEKPQDADEAWGNIVYKIYAVNSNDLKELDTISKTTYSFEITSKSAEKYIIKTAYQNYTNNMSSGSEIIISLPKEITISLNGKAQMALELGTTFKDPGYIVKEDSKDVTSKATLKKKTITNDATGKTVEKIDTSVIGNYTISYSIEYSGITKTLKREIVITPASSSKDETQDKENEKVTQ